MQTGRRDGQWRVDFAVCFYPPDHPAGRKAPGPEVSIGARRLSRMPARHLPRQPAGFDQV